MIIILEGNEAVFKSTVAEKLSKRLNFPIVKGSSFELAQCSNEELFAHFKKLAEMDNVIFDRFIYSNWNYATLYKDYAILTHEQRREIEDAIRHKATVYYLYADDEVIKQRISVRGDEYVNLDMVSKINEVYDTIIPQVTVNVKAYNTEEWSSDDIVESILL